MDSLPVPAIEERTERVAVVGSGPAGLTVAHDLRLKGYQVTPVRGRIRGWEGMLRLGIPDYRLPTEILDRESAAFCGWEWKPAPAPAWDAISRWRV